MEAASAMPIPPALKPASAVRRVIVDFPCAFVIDGTPLLGISRIPIWMFCTIGCRIGDYVAGVASAGGAGSHVGNPASGFPPSSTGSIDMRVAVELALPDVITVPSGAMIVKE